MTFNVFIKLLHRAAIIQTPGPGTGMFVPRGVPGGVSGGFLT